MSTLQVNQDSDQGSPMPSRKISKPTVSYSSIFPDHGHDTSSNSPTRKSAGPCEAIGEEPLTQGRYIELKKYSFRDAKGKERSAEGVHMVKNEQLPLAGL